MNNLNSILSKPIIEVGIFTKNELFTFLISSSLEFLSMSQIQTKMTPREIIRSDTIQQTKIKKDRKIKNKDSVGGWRQLRKVVHPTLALTFFSEQKKKGEQASPSQSLAPVVLWSRQPSNRVVCQNKKEEVGIIKK